MTDHNQNDKNPAQREELSNGCGENADKKNFEENIQNSRRDSLRQNTNESKTQKNPQLARWFWGTIIVMAAISVILSVMATINKNVEEIPEAPASTSSNETNNTVTDEELPASVLAILFDEGIESAREATISQIDPLLNDAYAPVYAQISNYADFHYSVIGEYSELFLAAGGNAGTILEEKMFEGMDGRLNDVSIHLQKIFSANFEKAINFDKKYENTELGAITRQAISNASQRMIATAPTGVAVTLGTKKIAAIIAKNVAKKLVTKGAIKTGGKWAAVLSGIGGGTLSCSWSGPAAPVCGVAGGIIAWVAADYSILALDEYWNRQDFEKEISSMIDEQKTKHRNALEAALNDRAIAVQEETWKIVEQQDFTLRDLSGEGNADVCLIAEKLASQYDHMNHSLAARTPKDTRALKDFAESHTGSLSLRRLAVEVRTNLENINKISITTALVSGNLPLEQRADRDISGVLQLADNKIEIPRTPATEEEGFEISLKPNMDLWLHVPLYYSIKLEQHLWFSNQHFEATGTPSLIKALDHEQGLEQSISLQPVILSSNVAKDNTHSHHNGWDILLELGIRAERLPDLEKLPNCP